MIPLIKPMLSGTVDNVETLRYPLLASPKLDGYRASVQGGVVLSRNLKPIPNKRVQKLFGLPRYEGLDGELIVGAATAPDAFRATSSGVTRADGEPDVWFHAFDVLPSNLAPGPFIERLRYVCSKVGGRALAVPHTDVLNAGALARVEEQFLAAGYEGVMLRDPQGLYKQGRSTAREGWLLKLKRFEDAEGVVIGYEEQMHNANEATKDALGYTHRTAHKVNKHGKGVLGAVKLRGLNGPYKGVGFNVGTGFDDAERAALWSDRKSLLGRTVKYKFFPSGSKDAPRFPTFLAFINREDVPL